MPHARANEGSSARRWVLLAVALVALARLVLLAIPAGLTLAEDEALYWEWSRYPALGYATKPGGVAWLIWLSTAALGHTEFAVRLPAVVSGAVGMFAAGMLAWDMTAARRTAVLSALAYACTPVLAVLGLIMTIDAPMLAAWAVALWAAHRAAVLGRPRWWLVCGLAIAIGVQFKPTILLLPPGILLFLLASRRHRPPVAWPQLIAAALVAAAGLIPTILYNARNDWAQLQHLLGHLGLGHAPHTLALPSPPWSPLWTIEYPFVQLAMGGATAVLGLIALTKLTSLRSTRLRTSALLCACAGLPLLLVYFAVTFITRVEANWPVAAWIGACPLAAWAAALGMESNDRGLRIGAAVGGLFGLALLIGLPLAPLLSGTPIPVHRLTGFDRVAREVEGLRSQVREREALEPIVMAVSYGRTAQLAFSLSGQPTVYATARYTTGGEGRQYDLWVHTNLERRDVQRALVGRPGVMLGGNLAHWASAFERVEPAGTVENEPGKAMGLFVGHGYRGFGK